MAALRESGCTRDTADRRSMGGGASYAGRQGTRPYLRVTSRAARLAPGFDC